jgi:hypothetical protein
MIALEIRSFGSWGRREKRKEIEWWEGWKNKVEIHEGVAQCVSAAASRPRNPASLPGGGKRFICPLQRSKLTLWPTHSPILMGILGSLLGGGG